jgi:hypothetical protein
VEGMVENFIDKDSSKISFIWFYGTGGKVVSDRGYIWYEAKNKVS